MDLLSFVLAFLDYLLTKNLFQNNIDGAKGIKVENISKGSLDSIPSPSMKMQIMGRKVCLGCKGKTLQLPRVNFVIHNLYFQ